MTTLELSSIAACSLDPDSAARRAADFRALLGPNLRARERDGPAVVLELSLGVRGERVLTELLRLEQECCPFFAFRLDFLGAHVELTVRAPEQAQPLVDALFGTP